MGKEKKKKGKAKHKEKKKKTKAKHEDAQLILKLYELRREEKLRAARDWFATQFFPESIEDFKAVFASGNPHNVQFRMVVSYWDMAASFAVAGALNPELLLPEYLRNIEAVIKMVDWAPDRVRWVQNRFSVFRAQSAQAATGS